MPTVIEKAHELDTLLCTHAPVAEIRDFFRNNQEDLTAVFPRMICWSYLLSPEFINILETQDVKKIGIFLSRNTIVSYNIRMHFCAAMIMSEWIAPAKRAIFWHVLKKQSCSSGNLSEPSLEEHIACARKTFLFHIMPGEKSDFIKNTEIGSRNFDGSEELKESIRQDSVSAFEKSRKKAGQKISEALLLYLLQSDAAKCFMHLLEKFTRQVFQCRSQTEWLFTVCRGASAQTAIPVIQWMEERDRGIIAKARDPWGNTLLWHTLARSSAEEIQLALVYRGCDPYAVNQWGLSWRLVLQNAI